jgi:Protein of unknown function (DUF3090)
VSILLEKTQAMIAAGQIEEMEELDTLLSNLPPDSADSAHIPELETPVEVMFRAGKLALQYDEALKLVGLEMRELPGIDQGTPAVFRLWVTPRQAHLLAEHARQVIRGGLPIG